MRRNKNNIEFAKPRQKTVGSNWKTQVGYYLMLLPPALWIVLTSYIPMAGIYMAFIDYKPAKGILGSKFVGLKYFKEFLGGYDFVRVF